VSGNWNNGGNVSPFYWNGNNTPSNANINIGSRAVILFAKASIERARTTLPKGKITHIAARLVAETVRTSRSVKDETVKTWKDIVFDSMFTLEQAKLAAWRASEHKRDRAIVQAYLNDELLLVDLVDDLHHGTYKPKMVKPRQIYDRKSNKWRTIVMPAFRDQIVHWMIMLRLEPHMTKTFVSHTIAAIPKRGPALAHKAMRHWAKCHKTETRWIIKADIKHYYQNIDHEILLTMLSKRIRDRKVIAVIESIVRQYKDGLPLGFYLSQWLSNFYLCEFDHYVKETLGVKHYLRYVDDLFFGVRSKSMAKRVVKAIRTVLHKLGLRIKEVGTGALRVFRWASARFVDYIGMRTYRDGFQELRKKTYLAIRRLVGRIRKRGAASLSQARSLLSRMGFVKHTDSTKFKREVVSTVSHYRLRRIVSTYEKHHAA
jgi:hypothetical protein